jgi:hypothetical protein
MKKILLICFPIFLSILISCSEDGNSGENLPPVDNTVYDDGSDITDNIVISHFRITSKQIMAGTLYNYLVYDNEIVGNKFTTGTKTFVEVVPASNSVVSVGNQYLYNEGKLTSFISEAYNIQCHYDAMGRLEAAENYGVNYHFSYPSEHIVVAEELASPYNNGIGAAVSQKIILRFSGYDNLIGISKDLNNDNLPDAEIKFMHRNGNVVKVVDGSEVADYQYNDMINTGNIVKEQTYGKVNYVLINAKGFLGDYGRSILSRNVLIDPNPDPHFTTNYDINEQHFVTKSENSGLSSTTFYIYTEEFTLE